MSYNHKYARPLHELVDDFKNLTPELIEYFKTAVKDRKNILILSETGVGKTTFLGVLTYYSPSDRIAVLEDTRELNLRLPFVAYFSPMPVLNEATVITWMDTFQKCLQTKPDRIILDEIRTGEEAYYFLTALSAGHTGSMATMHASGIYDRLQRLELLIKDYKTDIDNITIRTFIADSLDILVFLNIQKDKESDNVIRTIKELAEINGLKNDGSYNLKYIIPR